MNDVTALLLGLGPPLCEPPWSRSGETQPGVRETRLRLREAALARKLAAVREVKAPPPLGIARGAADCAVLPEGATASGDDDDDEEGGVGGGGGATDGTAASDSAASFGGTTAAVAASASSIDTTPNAADDSGMAVDD